MSLFIVHKFTQLYECCGTVTRAWVCSQYTSSRSCMNVVAQWLGHGFVHSTQVHTAVWKHTWNIYIYIIYNMNVLCALIAAWLNTSQRSQLVFDWTAGSKVYRSLSSPKLYLTVLGISLVFIISLVCPKQLMIDYKQFTGDHAGTTHRWQLMCNKFNITV